MGRRTLVWLAPGQLAFVREVIAAAELELVGAGCPVRAQAGPVASDLATTCIDDLRSALLSLDADLAFLAAPGAFGTSPEDAKAALAFGARKGLVATMEPIPASALDLTSGGWATTRALDSIRLCPLARLSAPFRAAHESLDAFGRVRTLTVEAWCSPREGSLGARLFSAIELILHVMGEPESVDAAFVPPDLDRAVRPTPGDTLRDLHGDITASLRFGDGRAANLVASDHAGRWNRTATLLGPGGRLRVFDDGFEWIGADGKKKDESRPAGSRRGVEGAHAVAALKESLDRVLDRSMPGEPPGDHAAVLAIGQAILLSARTGQHESPGTIRRMTGLPQRD